MFKTILVLVVMTVSLSIVSGFMITQTPSISSSKMVRHASAADDDDDWKNIIGSEYNIEQYLGQDGWRYRMAKTEEEIKEDGDYTFFQRMFGATSNNKVRLAAREDARVNYQVDSEKQALNNEWIMKYGYKRFYTSYLDKAALTPNEQEITKKKTIVATPSKPKEEKKSEPKEEKKSGAMFSMPFVSEPKKVFSMPFVSEPKKSSSRPSAAQVSTPKVSSTVESTPVATPKETSTKQMTFTISPVRKDKGGGNLNLMKSPKKN